MAGLARQTGPGLYGSRVHQLVKSAPFVRQVYTLWTGTPPPLRLRRGWWVPVPLGLLGAKVP